METRPTLEYAGVDEARDRLRSIVPAGRTELVPLASSLNRALANSITTDVDDPPFHRAMMDGYAVRSGDLGDGGVSLEVLGDIPAGATSNTEITEGKCVHINTGAPIPPGADAVVPVEDTTLAPDGRVLIQVGVAEGRHIARRGVNTRAGDVVLHAPMRLDAVAMGVAAAAGAAKLSVYSSPRIGIITTGAELVSPDCFPEGGQIRNSNGPQLRGLAESCGCIAIDFGVVEDDRKSLCTAIAAALEQSDILCITGGVSMGAHDHVPECLERCGVQLHIRKMRIKPGKPVHVGIAEGGQVVCALPGNPVSAMVGFHLLVKPTIDLRQNLNPFKNPHPVAKLSDAIKPTTNRTTLVPAHVAVEDDGSLHISPSSWRGSGDPFGCINANALILRPENAPAAEPGAWVRFLPTGSIFG